jgi:hypothetical protein
MGTGSVRVGRHPAQLRPFDTWAEIGDKQLFALK